MINETIINTIKHYDGKFYASFDDILKFLSTEIENIDCPHSTESQTIQEILDQLKDLNDELKGEELLNQIQREEDISSHYQRQPIILSNPFDFSNWYNQFKSKQDDQFFIIDESSTIRTEFEVKYDENGKVIGIHRNSKRRTTKTRTKRR